MKFCRTYYDIKNTFIPAVKNEGKRICVNQGGTRSGKTYSILQFLIETAIRGAEKGMRGLTITICRKTYPALRDSALRDFVEILQKLGRYDENCHNLSTREYYLGNCIFEFLSVDQPQKIRGRKRDVLFCNEANELTFEDWNQLKMRTTGLIFIDYNPSDEYHWIYDNVLNRDDVCFFITNYTHNPHLKPIQIKEIEMMRDDPNYWKVFGLGEKGVSGATIFTNWASCKQLPSDILDRAYGVDFGFNHPSAVSKCVKGTDKNIYTRQVIYRTHLTNTELIQLMKSTIPQEEWRLPFYCDNAEPDRIKELKQAGFNAVPAFKNIKLGLDKLKSVKLFVTEDSVDGQKEVKNYKYKVDHNQQPTEEPVDLNNHFIDSIRYGSYNMIAEKNIKSKVATLV